MDDEIIIERIYIHNTIDNNFGNIKRLYRLKFSLNLKNAINQEESTELMSSFIYYIKSMAQKEGKKRVLLDCTNNFRFFDKYFEKEGFVLKPETIRTRIAEWIVEEEFCIK